MEHADGKFECVNLPPPVDPQARLGGLADRQHDVTKSGVPLLSDVPIIGPLFGKQIERTTEPQLFIFLTSRVLRTDEDMDAGPAESAIVRTF